MNLNPDDPEDRNIVKDDDYINLEKYLNNLCEKIWSINIEKLNC